MRGRFYTLLKHLQLHIFPLPISELSETTNVAKQIDYFSVEQTFFNDRLEKRNVSPF